MSNITPKLGSWLIDPESHENHPAYEDNRNKFLLMEDKASEVDLRRYASPVENQRDFNSCVGNAVVGGLELIRGVYGLEQQDLSRLFVYYNSRNEHSAVTQDSGTFVRAAMKSLKKFGVCCESTWEYDKKNVFTRPSWAAYREAFQNKIDDYYRIRSTGSDRIAMIEEALRAYNPIVFGMQVDEFFTLNEDGHPRFNSQTKFIGRHAMLITGFNARTRNLIVRNSWGDRWGDAGYCYLPYDVLATVSAGDFWAMTGLN